MQKIRFFAYLLKKTESVYHFFAADIFLFFLYPLYKKTYGDTGNCSRMIHCRAAGISIDKFLKFYMHIDICVSW